MPTGKTMCGPVEPPLLLQTGFFPIILVFADFLARNPGPLLNFRV
jgi:hypothetical protein